MCSKIQSRFTGGNTLRDVNGGRNQVMPDASQRIWGPYEVFYIEAMLSNTACAMRSVDRLSEYVEWVECGCSEEPFGLHHTNDLLTELQNLILQAAALSRYFWPVRSGHEGRASHLRLALSVDDHSPLRSRDLRNEIEHFDERIDAYLAEGIEGHIMPAYVGLHPAPNGIPTHMFKAYYVDTGVFEMLGNRYDIQPIADEIQRLHNLLLSCRDGGRLRTGSNRPNPTSC